MAYLPLKNALESYAARKTARFHMPGHKGFLSALDVTEVNGTDNLQSPHEAILESEKLCARALKARDAFFLVNGSTAGNLAMLFLAGCGRRVLLGRNCHKSAINGIALADQKCVPLFPDENGIFTADAVDAALDDTPCDAVFLTSPTYRGYVSDIESIAKVCRKHGALLLVDAAHGAHFVFSDGLPPVPNAADMWCVSTHKTLNALTQTAVLLVGESCPFTRSEVQSALNIFQSTSPSYTLMLSVESAVLEANNWDEHIKRIAEAEKRLRSINGVRLLGEGMTRDRTRLNIVFSGMTGYELNGYLEDKGIVPEMCDLECVTLITSQRDPDEWYERLISALSSLKPNERAEQKQRLLAGYPAGKAVVSVREAMTRGRELVDLEDSVGRVSAAAVGCYPPGTAALFPGETIISEGKDFLVNERKNGAELFGLSEGLVPVLKDE